MVIQHAENNGGIFVIDREDYIHEANMQLNDTRKLGHNFLAFCKLKFWVNYMLRIKNVWKTSWGWAAQLGMIGQLSINQS